MRRVDSRGTGTGFNARMLETFYNITMHVQSYTMATTRHPVRQFKRKLYHADLVPNRDRLSPVFMIVQ